LHQPLVFYYERTYLHISFHPLSMKRILSLTLAVMLLASGLHLTVASHYCGGTLAQVKWSLNHEVAACGMEGENTKHTNGTEWHASCCKDVVSMWGTDSHFDVSASPVIHSISQPIASFVVAENVLINTPQLLVITSIFPPGSFQPSCVKLPRICVYRI